MKVLIINGSPRANGNTDIALREMEKVFTEEGGMEYIGGCEFTNYCRRESDFCSYGERKEGAD